MAWVDPQSPTSVYLARPGAKYQVELYDPSPKKALKVALSPQLRPVAGSHAQHADGHAKIRIDTLEAIDSSLPRRQLRFVLAWAELHQAELEENWHLARQGGTIKPIEPLR